MHEQVLVITAHPDDEVIWCGGTIIREVAAGNLVTVICCSIPRNEAPRALEFYLACQRLGARGVLYPRVETEPGQLLDLEWMPGFLERYLPEEDVDRIYTHGPQGEYGHSHHKHVHSFVTDYTKSWDVELYCFAPPNPELEAHPLQFESDIDVPGRNYALQAYRHHPGSMKKHEALRRTYPWSLGDTEGFIKWK